MRGRESKLSWSEEDVLVAYSRGPFWIVGLEGGKTGRGFRQLQVLPSDVECV